MRARLVLLLVAAAPLAGCGAAPTPGAASMGMPTLGDVASSNVIDRSCACLMRTGTCAMLADAVPGHFETRNLQCAIVSRGEGTVRCRFEQRFVTEYDRTPGQPGPWQREVRQLRTMPGGWCVG
jgi:hypothetical protein